MDVIFRNTIQGTVATHGFGTGPATFDWEFQIPDPANVIRGESRCGCRSRHVLRFCKTKLNHFPRKARKVREDSCTRTVLPVFSGGGDMISYGNFSACADPQDVA